MLRAAHGAAVMRSRGLQDPHCCSREACLKTAAATEWTDSRQQQQQQLEEEGRKKMSCHYTPGIVLVKQSVVDNGGRRRVVVRWALVGTTGTMAANATA